MARLPAGQKPTPRKDRVAGYREELTNRGGHRLIADLEPNAHEALKTITDRVDPPLTQKAAVSAALIDFASRKAPKAK
jgi:hypothetical protein